MSPEGSERRGLCTDIACLGGVYIFISRREIRYRVLYMFRGKYKDYQVGYENIRGK